MIEPQRGHWAQGGDLCSCHGDHLTLAFCRTVPLPVTMTERGLFLSAVAELTGVLSGAGVQGVAGLGCGDMKEGKSLNSGQEKDPISPTGLPGCRHIIGNLCMHTHTHANDKRHMIRTCVCTHIEAHHTHREARHIQSCMHTQPHMHIYTSHHVHTCQHICMDIYHHMHTLSHMHICTYTIIHRSPHM